MRILRDKHIVLGVTGSIAAYKAVGLASRLVQAGATVDVIMTEAATELVQPLSFQAITHRPVVTEMFTPSTRSGHRLLAKMEIGHVTLAQRADLMVIAPATANTIAKLAAGLADNMLTATALATRAPIIIAPAMESAMYESPVTQENLARLRQRGVTIVEPGYGRLASGAVGVGRLAEMEDILGTIRLVLGQGGDLAGRRVVVTAGGTREPIDPLRFVGNRSSGRMGYALAEAARDRGAKVTLVAGPTALITPPGVQFVPVDTAQEMRDAVLAALPGADVLIMAAAVADYRPAEIRERKIKKGEGGLTLKLVRNPDILAQVARWRESEPGGSRLVVVGFAAETEDLVENARAKLEAKGLDLIVANPVPVSFGAPESQATLIDHQGEVTELPLLPKEEIAERVLDRVVGFLRLELAKGPRLKPSG
ncbi:MAG: bifunctional phosphopantothenoylcysteine decarboxylase/phosphopantothenate--cysteine ligase CoaBC [Anaerolineae bacterium]